MTSAVAMQVFWRFVLSSPLAWTEETARLSMIWMVFLVMGWAFGNRTHIAAKFLVDRLPPKGRLWFEISTILTIAAFSILLVVTGTKLVILQSVSSNTPLGLPRSVFSLQVPICAFFVIIHAFDLLSQYLLEAKSDFNLSLEESK
jgi:TRAP-type C4-dicarboxylate transport system permease small subunit